MSERQPGWVRVGFRRVGAGPTTGSVVAVGANLVPFGKADGSGALDTRSTFVRTASTYGGSFVGIGTATPFSNLSSLAGLENGIDMYTATAGNYSRFSIGGYGGGIIAFTSGVRGSTEWFPAYITTGDGGLGGHDGHFAVFANKPGDTTGGNMWLCGDFYAGATTGTGGLAVPGGLAIGVGFHGAANGLYDPTGGTRLVLANDDGAGVSPTGAGNPRTMALRYFTNGGTVKKAQISFEGGAYVDIATGGAGVTPGTGITIASNVVSANISTGVAGGQTAFGGTAAGESLILSSTAHATKGLVLVGNFFAIDEVNGRVLIGTQVAGAGAPLTIAATNGSGFSIWAQAGIARFDTALGVNVTPPAGIYVQLNQTATRDAILIGLGGGPAIADGTARQYLDVSPSATVVTPATAGTNWLTVRFRQQTYTLASGAASLSTAATVWIDGPPVFSGAGSFGTGYQNEAFHVDSGISRFNGIVKVATAAGLSALFADGPNQIVGVFGTSSTQRVNTAGNVTAGATYTASEQKMLTDCYSALRAYGWLT